MQGSYSCLAPRRAVLHCAFFVCITAQWTNAYNRISRFDQPHNLYLALCQSSFSLVDDARDESSMCRTTIVSLFQGCRMTLLALVANLPRRPCTLLDHLATIVVMSCSLPILHHELHWLLACSLPCVSPMASPPSFFDTCTSEPRHEEFMRESRVEARIRKR